MKNLISILIFILFALLAMWWYYSCDWCLGDRNKEPAVVEEKIDPAIEAKAKKAYEDSLALASGLYATDIENTDVFRYPQNLQINNVNTEVFVPINIRDFDAKIANHLGTHQDQELNVYGYETSSERDSGKELGLARAGYIKNILVKAGVNGDRVITNARLHDYEYNEKGKYNGGILLNFKTIDEDRLKEVEKGIANKTLYSEFASKEFKADANLQNYATELKSYLIKYPEKKVVITGHTDNVGNSGANARLGKVRSTNVKDYLVSRGIPESKLTAKSKGESSPIAPNDTEEGRAKNRRIEIIVN